MEAIEQITRALAQIATLQGTATLRREEIKLQVGLANALTHVKGYAAPDTKAAVERARIFIEQAEALGEPPEDPSLLFSVLYGIWAVNALAFQGDPVRELSAQFLELAEKKGTTLPLMIAHRLMCYSLLYTSDFVQAQMHSDKALALYDPIEHRPLAMRFGQDTEVAVLTYRSRILWLLGYPEAAQADAEYSVKVARELGQAATLMFALSITSMTQILCGNHITATTQGQEVGALSEEKGSVMWKSANMMNEGSIWALTGKASSAIQIITSALAPYRSTGATIHHPWYLMHLASAYAELGQLDEAWRSIGQATTAVETTKETWCEAEVQRIAGEVALTLPARDTAKAETYFGRALAVARAQQAKSWELRAAMSMARLWRDQDKRDEASDLLAPVYGWFTEGFDTLDLKEAKALLDDLAKAN